MRAEGEAWRWGAAGLGRPGTLMSPWPAGFRRHAENLGWTTSQPCPPADSVAAAAPACVCTRVLRQEDGFTGGGDVSSGLAR